MPVKGARPRAKRQRRKKVWRPKSKFGTVKAKTNKRQRRKPVRRPKAEFVAVPALLAKDRGHPLAAHSPYRYQANRRSYVFTRDEKSFRFQGVRPYLKRYVMRRGQTRLRTTNRRRPTVGGASERSRQHGVLTFSEYDGRGAYIGTLLDDQLTAIANRSTTLRAYRAKAAAKSILKSSTQDDVDDASTLMRWTRARIVPPTMNVEHLRALHPYTCAVLDYMEKHTYEMVQGQCVVGCPALRKPLGTAVDLVWYHRPSQTRWLVEIKKYDDSVYRTVVGTMRPPFTGFENSLYMQHQMQLAFTHALWETTPFTECKERTLESMVLRVDEKGVHAYPLDPAVLKAARACVEEQRV